MVASIIPDRGGVFVCYLYGGDLSCGSRQQNLFHMNQFIYNIFNRKLSNESFSDMFTWLIEVFKFLFLSIN